MPDEKNLPFRECLACDMQEHRFAKPLDHPDGCVTYEKLSPEAKNKFSQEVVGEVLKQMPDASCENFTALYNQTSWEELSVALDAGKHIYAQAGANIYVMISLSTSRATFTRAQQTSIDCLVLDSQNKWSSSSVRMSDANNIKFADGEDLETKYAALEARVASLEA